VRLRPRALLSFRAPAPTHTYPLPLHDALPISATWPTSDPERLNWVMADAAISAPASIAASRSWSRLPRASSPVAATADIALSNRSEEHTSELQSRENLVCRLLLEKKKRTRKTL